MARPLYWKPLMGKTLPILTFHSIDLQSAATSITPRVFESGLALLQHKGYRTIDACEAAGLLQQGRSISDGRVGITFDDGYRSVYETAFPVLQDRGMTATLYLTVGNRPHGKAEASLPSLGGRAMMTWGQIREMQRHGFDIGAHTLTHPDLTRLPLKELHTEVEQSKAVLEDVLGTPVKTFAYPFGRYNGRVRELVGRLFDCACSTELGLVTQHSDSLALERIDAYYLRTNRLFRILCTRWLCCYLAVRNVPRKLKVVSFFKEGYE